MNVQVVKGRFVDGGMVETWIVMKRVLKRRVV